MLPREEWLPDAQALPVGRSERVYHDRVVFSFPECIIGRDFIGKTSAKCKVYNGSSKLSYVHFQAKTTDDTREGTQESTVVLTEDILSAIKVRWYTTLPCIALRGTAVRTDTLAVRTDTLAVRTDTLAVRTDTLAVILRKALTS